MCPDCKVIFNKYTVKPIAYLYCYSLTDTVSIPSFKCLVYYDI